MMSEAQFYDILRQGLWASIIMSAPILGVALGVGLLVGLFQALTSIQEMTLTFVPKVAAMLAIFWVSMSTMTQTITFFWTDGIIPLIAGG